MTFLRPLSPRCIRFSLMRLPSPGSIPPMLWAGPCLPSRLPEAAGTPVSPVLCHITAGLPAGLPVSPDNAHSRPTLRLHSTSKLSCWAASQQQHPKLSKDRYWQCLAPPKVLVLGIACMSSCMYACQLSLVQTESQGNTAVFPTSTITSTGQLCFPCYLYQMGSPHDGAKLATDHMLWMVARPTLVTVCLWWALSTVQIVGAVAPISVLNTPPPPAAYKHVC